MLHDMPLRPGISVFKSLDHWQSVIYVSGGWLQGFIKESCICFQGRKPSLKSSIKMKWLSSGKGLLVVSESNRIEISCEGEIETMSQ